MLTWMLFSLLAAALVAGAARAAETALRLAGRAARYVWVLGMVTAAVLPVMFRFLPRTPVSDTNAGLWTAESALHKLATVSLGEQHLSVLGQFEVGSYLDPLLMVSWAAAAIVIALVVLSTYRRLDVLASRAPRSKLAGIPVTLTESTGPMVVGLRTLRIVVPFWLAKLPADQQQVIMRHEHEHLRAGDPRLLQGAALLVMGLPWMLPLWWMLRRLRDAIEIDCDARVLASGADSLLYGETLIGMAGRLQPSSFLAPALVELSSPLERRIAAMNAKPPTYRGVRLCGACCVAALSFAAACEMAPKGNAGDLVGPGELRSGEQVASAQLEASATDEAARNTQAELERLMNEAQVGRIQPNGDTVWTRGVVAERTRPTPSGFIVRNGERIPVYNVQLPDQA